MVNQTNPYNQIEKIGENREGERGREREMEGERDGGREIFRASPSGWPPSKRGETLRGKVSRLVASFDEKYV